MSALDLLLTLLTACCGLQATMADMLVLPPLTSYHMVLHSEELHTGS